jgi:hypothetical protein
MVKVPPRWLASEPPPFDVDVVSLVTELFELFELSELHAVRTRDAAATAASPEKVVFDFTLLALRFGSG